MTEDRVRKTESQTESLADYDNPWKEGLDRYLEQFLQLAFPAAHPLIDWSRSYESLDQELQQVVRDAELGKRIADKLFKVWLQGEEEAYVLIHVEVQGQEEADFAERMYVYNYRCYDRYRRPVMSLAVLGDERASWRPSSFGYNLGGCEAGLKFPIAKLLDYQTQWEELEQNSNPFAIIVMAHLKTKATTGNPQQRKQWKWNLVRRLFERGYDREDVLQLFRLVDWMMALPQELQGEFRQELTRYQEENQMPLLSRIELMAKEEGRQEGIVQTARQSAIAVLETRFQEVPAEVITGINNIDDVVRLQQLLRLAVTVTSVTEFQQILRDSRGE